MSIKKIVSYKNLLLQHVQRSYVSQALYTSHLLWCVCINSKHHQRWLNHQNYIWIACIFFIFLPIVSTCTFVCIYVKEEDIETRITKPFSTKFINYYFFFFFFCTYIQKKPNNISNNNNTNVNIYSMNVKIILKECVFVAFLYIIIFSSDVLHSCVAYMSFSFSSW